MLTGAESKVATYVLAHARDILTCTVTELAELAGASDATVVRFCRSVGYKGFQDFKIELAKDVITPAKHLNPELEQGDDTATIVKKIFTSEIAVLQETLNVVDMEQLDRAAQAIFEAGHIEIFGSGGSGYVGKDAMHKFLKIGIECHVHNDADIQAMAASLMKPGDVAIGISHGGGNKNVVECIRLAKKAGALTIALTTQGRSPLLRACDLALCTSTKETVFKSESVTARIAQLAVIDSLVAAVALRNYEPCYDAIQKTRSATSNRKL